MDKLSVNNNDYTVLCLLGKGKSGYSYLVADKETGKKYVIKQIHHEPCDYYTFGNKLESEINDYRTLKALGIPMPELLETDTVNERLLKEYIDGSLISELAAKDSVPESYFSDMERLCGRLYAAGLNIDYYPTNFAISEGKLYYLDYECNVYSDRWNFENWGIVYWRHFEA